MRAWPAPAPEPTSGLVIPRATAFVSLHGASEHATLGEQTLPVVPGRRRPLAETPLGADPSARSHLPTLLSSTIWFVGYADRIDRRDDDLRRALATTPVFAVEVVEAADGPSARDRAPSV